jgi:hypothetical protein
MSLDENGNLVIQNIRDIYNLSQLKKSVCFKDGRPIHGKKCLNASFIINMNGMQILQMINSGLIVYNPKSKKDKK